MSELLSFIKEFHPSSYGIGFWEIVIVCALMIVISVIVNKLSLFLQPSTARRVNVVVSILFNSIFFGVIILAALNASLNSNYERLGILIFISLLPYLRTWTWTFYKKYDLLVDKLINK